MRSTRLELLTLRVMDACAMKEMLFRCKSAVVDFERQIESQMHGSKQV